MSESTQVRARDPEPAGGGSPLLAGARVDAAHVLGSAPPEPAGAQPTGAEVLSSAAAGQLTLDLLPRLRLQGRQLAQLLSEREQDLDRREAQQHAQVADLDNQMRAARLWLVERQEELAQHAANLAERERSVTEAEMRIAAAASHVEDLRRQSEQGLGRREEAASQRDGELVRLAARLNEQAAALRASQQQFAEERAAQQRQLQIEQQQSAAQSAAMMASVRQALAALERRRQAIEFEGGAVARRRAELTEIATRPSAEQQRIARELEQIAGRIEERAQRLAAAEQLQERAENELSNLARDLESERQRVEQQAQVDRRRLAERERELLAEVEKERDAVHRQLATIDTQRVSLERLREEVTSAHGAALETRLAAEEAYTRLAAAAAPATVVLALAETRARIADHYLLVAERIAAERVELNRTAEDVATQSRRLTAQKGDLQAWGQRRQQEFDLQAAALAEREQELRQLEVAVRFEHWQWNEERLAHEKELRREAARLRNSND